MSNPPAPTFDLDLEDPATIAEATESFALVADDMCSILRLLEECTQDPLFTPGRASRLIAGINACRVAVRDLEGLVAPLNA